MRAISWNLNGLDPADLDARTEAAIWRMMLGGPPEVVLTGTAPPPPPPDVLLLQEVVERTWHAHLVPHLTAAGYHLFPTEPPARSYFEVIASRTPFLATGASRFERTGMGRCLNRVELGGLTVFTAHFESLKQGAELRMEQAQRVLTAMANCSCAIFGGDTNLRKAEAEALHFPEGVTDAWEQSGASSTDRATWGNARYDRFWTLGIEVGSFCAFGDEVVPGLPTAASDHKGIEVVW